MMEEAKIDRSGFTGEGASAWTQHYERHTPMTCPHCHVAIHVEFDSEGIGKDKEGYWSAETAVCPACKRLIVTLHRVPYAVPIGGLNTQSGKEIRFFAYPHRSTRPLSASEVPNTFADDYNEACATLNDSPKAAAALARRCLQHILRECVKVKPADLIDEINEAISTGRLPSHINSSLDSVRNVGNFAAHPIKSKRTGEILDVEPGEAEWTLNTVEALFDFCFVEPAKAKERADKLNAKLREAGKQPLKT
jgi:hypothetical protein